ncbi:glycosyltransferase family 2 protein [Spirosoma soli]|uniref:Glycosyltransferase family 2 protein n=1 Tax=Spirosoma soli TaxID=1770529 RepID=A0ABW5M8J3_9BACT
MIKVSILIPTYKRPVLVVEAIQSCLNQTYAPYEIIIGDDSPDELTKSVVEQLQTTSSIAIKHIHNKPSLGQEHNVNRLFDLASGDKIMLLHDDDLLVPDALETLVNCYINDPTISVAYGKQYIISNDGVISKKSSRTFNEAFYRTEQYEGSKLTSLEAGLVQQFPNNAYLINADLAKKVKYRPIGEACDFDFGFRVGQTGEKIHFVNKFTAKYRLSAVAVSTNPRNESGLISYLMVKDTAVPQESIKYKDAWLKSRAGVAVGQAISNGKIDLAIDIFLSKYHFAKMFTPGGVKRFGRIVLSGHFLKMFTGLLGRRKSFT